MYSFLINGVNMRWLAFFWNSWYFCPLFVKRIYMFGCSQDNKWAELPLCSMILPLYENDCFIVCKQQRCRPACASSSLISTFDLFCIWKVWTLYESRHAKRVLNVIDDVMRKWCSKLTLISVPNLFKTIDTIRSLFLVLSLWWPLLSHFDYIDDD